MRLNLLLVSIIGLLDGVKGQCDDECNLQEDMQNNPLVKCGKIVGEHPIYGKKCIYLTKTRLAGFTSLKQQ